MESYKLASTDLANGLLYPNTKPLYGVPLCSCEGDFTGNMQYNYT